MGILSQLYVALAIVLRGKLLMNMNKFRLKWRVFAFLLLFCALLLVLLWLFQTVFLNDMYRFIRKRELTKVISMVEREIGVSDLQTLIQKAERESDVMITPTPEFVPPEWPGLELKGGPGKPPMQAIAETREFTLNNGRSLSLTFYALLVPVSATVSTLRLQLLIITGVVLVLAILLAMVIAQRVSKPIEKISESAKALAQGDYRPQFDGKGFLEIVALSDTLNTAALELGKVEGLRRELLANVSHDLRTPLALIYSYAEMMHDFPDEVNPEQASVIMAETQRLTALVNDLLDVAKLEEGFDLNLGCFNLTQLIAEIVERMADLLKTEGFMVCFERAADVFVIADEVRLGQAFYNLLVNAVNYSGASRIIIIRQNINEKIVRISIIDQGEGIEAADLPLIWDRYYKGGKEHTRAVTGTGLGLSIVKKILDTHGFSYGVDSEVGQGSTFWFELGISAEIREK